MTSFPEIRLSKARSHTDRVKARAGARRHRMTSRLEVLEDRTLLAAPLLLTGNTFLIEMDTVTPPQIDTTVDGVTTMHLASLVSQIDLTGNPGNDKLTVDSSHGLIPIPINYNASPFGINQLILQQMGGSAPLLFTDRVDVNAGSSPSQGESSVADFGGNLQTINFYNLSPIYDSLPAVSLDITPSIPASLLNASNAINYTVGRDTTPGNPLNPAWGVVTVDTYEPLNFTNKDYLGIDAGPGSDEINLNNPNVPTGSTPGGLKDITVDGGDPTASDKLIVNGTTATETITYTPDVTVADDNMVAITALPTVHFSDIENLVINGQGGNDTLKVVTPAGPDTVTLTPGAAADSGDVTVTNTTGGVVKASATPLSFTNLGATGRVFFEDTGPSSDTLKYQDTTLANTVTVAADPVETGKITDGLHVPVFTGGVANLVLDSLANNQTFSIAGKLKYTSVTVNGDPTTVNFTGDGTAPVTLSLTTDTVQETGFAPVTLVGVDTLNVDAAGQALKVLGTGSTGETLNYAPTGLAAGTVTASDSKLTTNFINAGGTFTLDPGPGSIGAEVNIVVPMAGTHSVVASGGPAPVVQVDLLKTVSLVTADTALLYVTAGDAVTKLTVDSTAGGYPIPITFDGGSSNQSTVTLTQTTATSANSDTYSPGPNPGEGISTIVFPAPVGVVTQTVNFENLAPVIDLVPAPTFTVNGTPANNAINYTAGAVATNGKITIDNLESIEFSNKVALTINGQAGSDEINLNNPTVPTGLASIAVNGGDPTASDTLIVNGTVGSDSLEYDPAVTSGSGAVYVYPVVGPGLPTVNFTGIEHLAINGQGGDDSMYVYTPVGPDQVTYTPGATLDSGSVGITSTAHTVSDTTLSYSNLGPGGQVFFGDLGPNSDTLKYEDTTLANTVTVAADPVWTGKITDGLHVPVFTGGVANLVLDSLANNQTFKIAGTLKYTSVTVNGDPTTVNFTGDGIAPVTLSLATDTIRETGFAPVTLVGVDTLNVAAGGQALTVVGTGSTGETLNYAPTSPGASGTVTASDSSLTTNFTGVGGAFTLDPGLGSIGAEVNIVVPFAGTHSVVASGGPAPVVQVDLLKTVSLVPADTALLYVTAGDAVTKLTVDSTAGGYPIPITFDGGSSNQSTVTLTQTTATSAISDTYSPGPNPGEGISTIVFPAPMGVVTQTVNFENLAPVIDLVPAATFTVNGTPANNAINYTAGWVATNGKITIDNLESIEFSNKVALTINGQAGSDEINLNNPTVPTGLTGITVNGGDPTASDKLIVNGTAGADVIGYAPTGLGAGSVTVSALPTVLFTGIEALTINGQGGGDTLNVTTPVGTDQATLTPGPGADAGSIAITNNTNIPATTYTPLTFLNLGVALTGAQVIFSKVSGGPADTLIYNGTAGNDTFGVTGVAGATQVTLTSALSSVQYVIVSAPGVSNLVLNGLGGTDTFNITAPLPASLAGIFLQAGPSDPSVANLAGDGSNITTTLGAPATTVVGGGLGTVTITGIGIVNLKSGAGNVKVVGTAGLADNIAVTPQTSSSASIQDNGVAPIVNLTTTTGALTVGGNVGDTDTVTVNGTSANDLITLMGTSAASNPTVSVNTLLPFYVDKAGTAAFVVQSGLGTDQLVINSAVYPFTVPVTYNGAGGVGDSLMLTGGTALSDTYTPGAIPGSGSLTLSFPPAETVNFLNLAPVLDVVSSPLVVDGTPANDIINYTTSPTNTAHGYVTVNSAEPLEFANKSTLNINGEGGNDTITINNPNMPAGLTSITVNGASPNGPVGNNTLVVNAQGVPFTSAGINSTSTQVLAIPGAIPVPINYSNIQQVNIINTKDALTPIPIPTPLGAVAGIPNNNVLVGSFQFSDVMPPPEVSSASQFLATINWGDGTVSSPDLTASTILQLAPVNGVVTFQVYGTHTYAVQGPYSITVTVYDTGSSRTFTPLQGSVPVTITANAGATTTIDTAANAANVASAPIFSEGASIPATEGKVFSGAVATLIDTNPGDTVANYPPGSVTIDWGDGSALDTNFTIKQTGTLPNGTIFTISGSHYYLEEGNYTAIISITRSTIINNVPTPGSSTVATSSATVADTAPTFDKIQPMVVTTEAVQFSGPVAAFTEIYQDPTNPSRPPNDEPITDFHATIDWGDGTPESVGTLVPNAILGAGHYFVTGTHTYADSGVNIGGHPSVPAGTYPITITVYDDGGGVVQEINNATVDDVPIILTGQLNPASDSGKYHNDGITDVNQPNFFGTSEAFSHVSLFANGVLVGQVQAGSDGSWSITSNRLADGTYAITATAIDQSGKTTTSAPVPIVCNATGTNSILIDTVGPRITAAAFNRLTDTATFTFEDVQADGVTPGSGLLVQSLSDAANYSLNRVQAKPAGTFIVAGISVTPGATGSDNVTVVFNNGAAIKGGYFQIISRAESVLLTSGIQDVAGNDLDGEFYGPQSASGNGVPGGNFVANFKDIHQGTLGHGYSGPVTIIGYPHPNDPPANFNKPTPVKKAPVKVVVGKTPFANRHTVTTKVTHKARVKVALPTKASLLAQIAPKKAIINKK